MLKKILKSFFYKSWLLINLPKLLINKVKFKSNLEVHGVLFIKNKGSFNIGNNVRINSSPTSNPIGGGVKTFFQVLPNGTLRIEDGVKMSNVAITCARKILISNDVYIGAGVAIFDTDFHPIDFDNRIKDKEGQFATATSETIIKSGAFIGTRSIVLKGVTIGEKSIVGAGSVVSKSIPDNEIWAGNPAVKIGSIK